MEHIANSSNTTPNESARESFDDFPARPPTPRCVIFDHEKLGLDWCEPDEERDRLVAAIDLKFDQFYASLPDTLENESSGETTSTTPPLTPKTSLAERHRTPEKMAVSSEEIPMAPTQNMSDSKGRTRPSSRSPQGTSEAPIANQLAQDDPIASTSSFVGAASRRRAHKSSDAILRQRQTLGCANALKRLRESLKEIEAPIENQLPQDNTSESSSGTSSTAPPLASRNSTERCRTPEKMAASSGNIPTTPIEMMSDSEGRAMSSKKSLQGAPAVIQLPQHEPIASTSSFVGATSRREAHKPSPDVVRLRRSLGCTNILKRLQAASSGDTPTTPTEKLSDSEGRTPSSRKSPQGAPTNIQLPQHDPIASTSSFVAAKSRRVAHKSSNDILRLRQSLGCTNTLKRLQESKPRTAPPSQDSLARIQGKKPQDSLVRVQRKKPQDSLSKLRRVLKSVRK